MKQRRKAAALQYQQSYKAPVVTAAGMGIVAENIIQKAEDNNVPVVYNKELTDLLCNVDVGEAIPPDLYEAVAHVIAYITDIDKKLER